MYRYYVGRKAVTHWIREGISSGQINENNIKNSTMVRNLIAAQSFVSPTHFAVISSFDITYRRKDDKRFDRADGPAYISIGGEKQWWKNGSLHRADGPAIVERNDNSPHVLKNIYINGRDITEEYKAWLAETGINIHRLDEADRTLLRMKWEDYGE